MFSLSFLLKLKEEEWERAAIHWCETTTGSKHEYKQLKCLPSRTVCFHFFTRKNKIHILAYSQILGNLKLVTLTPEKPGFHCTIISH